MEAERLHREAALLSNTLADFAENDVAGRKAVVDQIIDLRERWKDVRYQIDHGQPRQSNRYVPVNRPPKPTEIRTGMTEAEIRSELSKTRVNISKYKAKLADNPDSVKTEKWEQELARLEAIREQYDTELIRLTYETAQQVSGEGAG
ncbi:hypothetical protein BLX24_30050 [Arsenicibacter rosenii]|uniref:Uncharacterized protein n=2 Tax=Arsenicibacter rosenii TaxID=1750698 RepID=A0A1S2V9V9_9BACT|nr:hypothetical protein BLX24_30050 [Arsenicibacter rosenii]